MQISILAQLVCYYTNWSQYRTKIGKFMPEDIQPDLCTHIVFAFGWLKKNKLTSFESNDETKDGKIGLYERVVNLKKANPSLKVLLAIGKEFFLKRSNESLKFPWSFLEIISRFSTENWSAIWIRWLVVWHPKIQRRVRDKIRKANLHLQRYLLSTGSKFWWPWHRLGISKGGRW